MVWMLAAAAGIGAIQSIIGGRSASKQAAAQANAANRNAAAQTEAESKAIIKERLNTTIRNSYQAALMQQQLGLRKQQAAKEAAGIRAAALAAQGAARVSAAAAGNFGASVDAVAADIDIKAGEALATNEANLTTAIENYNAELDMMVLNTAQSAPNQQAKVELAGRSYDSSGKTALYAVGSALADFGLNYAMRYMKLNPGATAPKVPNAGQGLTMNPRVGLQPTARFGRLG